MLFHCLMLQRNRIFIKNYKRKIYSVHSEVVPWHQPVFVTDGQTYSETNFNKACEASSAERSNAQVNH